MVVFMANSVDMPGINTKSLNLWFKLVCGGDGAGIKVELVREGAADVDFTEWQWCDSRIITLTSNGNHGRNALAM